MVTAMQELRTKEESRNAYGGCEGKCECIQQQSHDASSIKYSSLLRPPIHTSVMDYALIGIKLREFTLPVGALWRLCW